MEKTTVQVGSSEIPSPTASTHSNNVLTAQAWPTKPKPLLPSKKENFCLAVYDLILIILPIALIVKTGLIILAHKLDETHTGSRFDQATALSRYLVAFNSQLITLFTIIFVTIISTVVKRYALYKAQEGAYLTELEQLQGSVSLPSTLKLILSLRSYSVMSCVLVATWSFYYLGSQAAKEEYQATLSEPYSKQYAMVQRADASSLFGLSQAELIQNNVTGYNVRDMNYRFANALLTKGQIDASKVDDPTIGTNDGPLIPDLGAVLVLAQPESTVDMLMHQLFGWVDVSKSAKKSSLYDQNLFSNFQGVEPNVVSWTPKKTTDYGYYNQMLGTYHMPTSYLSVSCGDFELLSLESFPNGTSYNTSLSLNATQYRSDAPKDSAGHSLREFNYYYRAPVTYNVSFYHDPNLVVVGGITEDRTLMSTCNITRKNVDVKVSCTTTGCYPHAMRWQNNTNEVQATSYSTAFDSLDLAERFLSNLTLSTGTTSDWMNDYSLLSNFLTPQYTSAWTPDAGYPLGSGPSQALTQVVNTYMTLSQSAFTSVGIVAGLENIPGVMAAGGNAVYQTLIINGAEYMRSYRINWRWIPIDLVASLILLVAAIVSWYLRMKTLAPDIFGYVSSLTRDNEHIPLPTEGSMLNGIDRARMLRNVKVKIGDIETSSSGERTVGRVGLAPADASIAGLQRERLYV